MKRSAFLFAVVGLLLCTSCSLRSRDTLEAEIPDLAPPVEHDVSQPAPSVPSADTRYLIQPADRLDVFFPAATDFGFKAMVRPDGYVTLPHFGDLLAEGRTAEELAAAISRQYAQVLRDPHAVVGLTETGPQPYYVFGEVNRPNRYDHERGLELLSAISAAGGARRTAALSSVIVIRVGADGAYSYQDYDLNDLLDADSPRPVWIQPRDIIVVPTSTIADIGIWIDQYVRVFLPPVDAFLRGRYYWYLASDLLDNDE